MAAGRGDSLLALCAFCLLCAVGNGQTTNLTLFQIAPCTAATVDTVSRFKSDIYAVQFNLSNCLNDSSAVHGLDNVTYVSAEAGLGLWSIGSFCCDWVTVNS